MNISQVLIDQAAERPGEPAIIEAAGGGARALTFGQMAERSARGAALLRSAKLHEGDRILVFQPMSIELYVVLLAVFRLGLVATVLDPSAGRRHIEQCCSIAAQGRSSAPPGHTSCGSPVEVCAGSNGTSQPLAGPLVRPGGPGSTASSP